MADLNATGSGIYPMRIGINALAWRPERQAGVDTYLRQLVGALQQVDDENEYVVFVAAGSQGQLGIAGGRFREVVCPAVSRWRAGRALWEELGLARQVVDEGIEVLLCAGGIVPTNLSVPAVQVIHDLQVYHYPENFSWLKRRFLQRMLPRSAEAASLTVASSAYTRREVVRFLRQRPEDTRVVQLAGRADCQAASAESVQRVRRQYDLEEEYLLCVATSHLHKNLHELVEAYGRADLAADLVLVGKRGTGYGELIRAIRQARGRERIRVLGRVAAEELGALYTGATGFVTPSLFEGFGMTVLEAMQCGCPVACSSLTALPEVAGEAALLFDPRDPEVFGEALDRISHDETLRERLREEGFRQAAKFDWQQTARGTMDALVEAMRGRTNRGGKER